MNATTASAEFKTNNFQLYRNALFIRFGGLGDILLSTPTVRALSKAMPGIEIDYVVGPGMADVLADLPYIRKVYEFDKAARHSAANLHALMRLLGTKEYDLFVNLQPNFRSALIGLATNAQKKVVFKKDRSVNPATGRVAHAIDDFFKHLGELGINSPIDRRMDFMVDPQSRSWIRDFLAVGGMKASDKLIVINPNATRAVNRWPVDKFADVCNHFAEEPNVVVAVIGDKGDADRFQALRSRLMRPDRTLDTTGRLTTRQLGALIERADAFLSCDTGPMHIGSALDAPLICLSGAADPNRTGPLSPRSAVIIDRSLPCIACQRRTCLYGDDIRCMNGITVDMVTSRIHGMLAAQRAALVLAG